MKAIAQIASLSRLPTFKGLELSDQQLIQDFTSRYPPYSDFNFVNLWSWNIDGQMLVAQYNGNLLVRFSSYCGQPPFYSFLGITNVQETTEILLRLSCLEGIQPALRCVPELSLNCCQCHAEQGRDNFDYVWSVDKLVKLEEGSLKRKRRYIEKFEAHYPQRRVERIDLHSTRIRDQILQLAKEWRISKGLFGSSVEDEFVALSRCLDLSQFYELFGLGVFVGEKLVAFLIGEIIHDGYFLAHFGKTDPSYIGISELITHELALHLKKLNCHSINDQEDMGLPGLRLSKQSWLPTGYLKKYSVSA